MDVSDKVIKHRSYCSYIWFPLVYLFNTPDPPSPEGGGHFQPWDMTKEGDTRKASRGHVTHDISVTTWSTVSLILLKTRGWGPEKKKPLQVKEKFVWKNLYSIETFPGPPVVNNNLHEHYVVEAPLPQDETPSTIWKLFWWWNPPHFTITEDDCTSGRGGRE